MWEISLDALDASKSSHVLRIERRVVTSAVCLKSAKPPKPERRYVSIPIATLDPTYCHELDLYQQFGEQEDHRLFRGRDFPLSDDDLEKLRARGVTRLFIRAGEQRAYQSYLRENLSNFVEDESLPATQRFQILNQVTQDCLQETFERGDVSETVEASRDMGRHTVNLMNRTDLVAQDVFSMIKHDFHTFTHSANVCSYSVLLAKGLGIVAPAQLEEIATGALLHDVGKTGIPYELLTKPGGLSDDERELIRSHPTVGFARLCRREKLTWGQLMMVYQHHERMDGKGYPVGVKGDEIHPWGQLCAIVDVFDALTSDRPYHRGQHITEVLSYLERESGRGLDSEMVKCWTSIMSRNC